MQSKLDLIIVEIKKKKSIAAVKDEFILKEINKILVQNKKFREKIDSASADKVSKSKEFKAIVKEVRAVLHRSHGQYQTDDAGKREKYLDDLKKLMANPSDLQNSHPALHPLRSLSLAPPPGDVVKLRNNELLLNEKILDAHNQILSTNISAKERLAIYPTIYSEIFAITGIPKSIVDLGSGINPVSFPFMGLSEVKYTALELSQKDCDFLVQYFTLMNDFIDGKALPVDLIEIKQNPDLLSKFSADIAFIFKVIEPIELSKSHKIGELIIERLKCKWVVVSFATKTISGNPMNVPRRKWFEVMLERLRHEFKIIKKDNEIFYVIRK